jgi:hypothetical protein
MVNFLLNSGILNTTFWVVLAALVVALAAGARAGRRVLTNRVFLACLAVGTLLNLAFGVYKGYTLPRDHLQDVVSAREFLAGRSLYPDDMSRRIQTTLEQEPPAWSLGAWVPGLAERESEYRHAIASLHWVQAHPPLMSVCVAPVAGALSVSGTYAVLCLLSFAATLLMLALVARGLDWSLSRGEAVALVLLALGWSPLIGTLRNGQSALILGLLLVAGWYCLRRGRPYLGGALVGGACCLKLFPGLLLVYLLLRNRRAFLGGAVTVLALTVVVGTLAGWHTFAEHSATSRGVMREYAAYANNLSLLAALARALDVPGTLSAPTRLAFAVLAGLLLGGLVALCRHELRPGAAGTRRFDLEYAGVLVLMILLSPVTWDHYLPVLLLPLALLGGRALQADAERWAWPAFLALLLVLSVPDTAVTWSGENLQPLLGRATCNLVLLSLRPFVLLGLCAWLGYLAEREPAAVTTPLPAPPPLPAAG